jgi:hypothetical protein
MLDSARKSSIIQLLISMFLVAGLILFGEQKVVAASSQTNYYPLASKTYIRSPTNSTYTSNLLTLNASVNGLVARNIKISMTYSLDGMPNKTLPTTIHPREHSLISATITGAAALQPLYSGSHNITVYTKYEINDATMGGAYYSEYIHYDNSTVYFTVSTTLTSEIPEFPSSAPLLIILLSATTTALIYRHSIRKHNQRRT